MQSSLKQRSWRWSMRIFLLSLLCASKNRKELATSSIAEERAAAHGKTAQFRVTSEDCPGNKNSATSKHGWEGAKQGKEAPQQREAGWSEKQGTSRPRTARLHFLISVSRLAAQVVWPSCLANDSATSTPCPGAIPQSHSLS